MYLTTTFSSMVELVGLIIIFILILLASFYTSKWVAKHSTINSGAKNMSVIESFQLAPGQRLQIMKVGDKYLVIGVTKEHIEMLCEIKEEELTFEKVEEKPQFQFQDVLALVKKKQAGDKINKDKQ